jgi:hypothetical protein
MSRTRRLGARSDISRHSAACSLHSTAEIICVTPDLCTRPMVAMGNKVYHRFAPLFHFGPNSDLSATALRTLRGQRSMRRAQ